MLREVFQKLDLWIQEENVRRRSESRPILGTCEIRVLGQTALLEANLGIQLFVTHDVDAYVNAEHVVQKKLDELLRAVDRVLDTDSSLIWMPKETQYEEIFKGVHVHGYIAKPEYVVLSKALKAPRKNRGLIQEYLAVKADETFLRLARKYELRIEDFLE